MRSGLRRSASAPRLIRWSIPGEEFTAEIGRPWTPKKYIPDSFNSINDIDVVFFQILSNCKQVLDLFTVDDLPIFQAALKADKKDIEFPAFKNILTGFSTRANDWQLKRLFDKIDMKGKGAISWDDICAFIIATQCLKTKELHQATINQFCTRIYPLIHKNRVIRIISLEVNGGFVIGSNDGMLTTWTREFKLKQSVRLPSSPQTQSGRQKWYTDFLYLTDINKIVVSTGDRELEFFDLSGYQFYFRINDLDTVPTCLSYKKLLNDKQHAIAWGDSNGNVSILLLSDFADLLHGWRVMQPMEAQPTMSISAVVAVPKVSFIRWKTHDEWTAKVKIEESEETVISCCNHEGTAVVIGRIFGLTPPWRDESNLGRRRRDITSSETTSSSRTLFSRRTVSNITSISSSRFSSIFVSKRRNPFEQRVFKIPKGVRVFEFSREKNVLVTGGMDRIIRIWNAYITASPIGKLIGHTSPLSFLRVNIEDNAIISASSDGCIKIWDLDGHACMTTFYTKVGEVSRGNLQSCAYSSSARSLLIVANDVSLVRLEINKSTKERIWMESHQSWECYGGCLFGSISDNHFSSCVDSKSCDYLQWEPVLSHEATVNLCKYNQTFNQLITASTDSSIRVWNFATGQLVTEVTDAHGGEPITCMCFDLTGRRLITGGRDGIVRIWNHHSGACLLELRPKVEHGDGYIISAVKCINIGTGRYIAIVGWNTKVTLYQDDTDIVWEKGSDEIEQLFLPPWRHDGTTVEGHHENICEIAVSKYSKLLSTGDFGGEICIWNAVSGHILKRLQEPTYVKSYRRRSINKLKFLESREDLKDAANLVSCGPGEIIHFWSLYASEPHYASFPVSSIKDVSATAIALGLTVEEQRLTDTHLFTGDELGWIQVWNIKKYGLRKPEKIHPPKLYTWRAHTERVTSTEVVNTKQLLVTTSVDCCARLWSWSGTFIGTFGQPTPWDVAKATSVGQQMGPFDVLMDPRTHAIPELQATRKTTASADLDAKSSEIGHDEEFAIYTRKIFGEPSSQSRAIYKAIAEALNDPESLLGAVDVEGNKDLTVTEEDLTKNGAHPKTFNCLKIYPMQDEPAFVRPRSYTDPERMMEDIEEAKLEEELTPLKSTLEDRILMQNN
ncbi:WD repeat-containing protein 49 [Taenia crassiceps]|uniref:WD repeat-containing protein 49 n=1 Tax=Taenia crassiceps TaxID=6207 RepID=A0ABR4QIS2_9CEST